MARHRMIVASSNVTDDISLPFAGVLSIVLWRQLRVEVKLDEELRLVDRVERGMVNRVVKS